MNRNAKRRMKIRELQLDYRLLRDENNRLKEELLLTMEINDKLEDELRQIRNQHDACCGGDDLQAMEMEEFAAGRHEL